MFIAKVLILLTAWGCCFGAWNESYPNPRYEFLSCNRPRSSHVCDPDAVLTRQEANRLDWLATEMLSATPCLCPYSCLPKNSGVTLGIFIKFNFTLEIANISDIEFKKLTKDIRKQWHLGKCDDDILILLVANTRQAEFDMGMVVEKKLTRKVARQIFNECAIHFEYQYFYQGLESMVNSYRDALRAFKVTNPKFAPPSMSLIVGISLGFVVLIILLIATALLKCRQVKQIKALQSRNSSGRSYLAPRNTESTAFQYQLCDAKQKDRNSSSSSDEGIDSDEENKSNETAKLNVPSNSDTFRRQLSDIAEENEEIETAIKFAMVNAPKNSNIHVTEL